MMKKSIMVFLALGILGLFAILWSSSQSQISEGTLALVNSIKNEDVSWTLGYVGLMPELTGASLELENSQEDINPLLVDALMDKDKFVAAHVLLTYRTPGNHTTTGGEWNGLQVNLLPNGGEATFDGNNLGELQKRWKKELGLEYGSDTCWLGLAWRRPLRSSPPGFPTPETCGRSRAAVP